MCLRKAEGEWEIIKFGKSEEGVLVEEFRYQVKHGVCNCEGFEFRRDCKHLQMANEKIETRPVNLTEARKIMKVLVDQLSGREFDYVRPDPEEPYVQEDGGKVVELKVEARCAQKRPKPLTLVGTWEGLRVRVRLL